MNNIYTIPSDQLAEVLRKGLLRQMKIMVIVLIIVILPPLVSNRKFSLTGVLSVIALILITVSINHIKAKRKYGSLAILLNEKDVEIIIANVSLKNIKWENLAIEVNPNGDITIYDRNFSAFQRRFNGQGIFIIPSEITDRDILLVELQAHVS